MTRGHVHHGLLILALLAAGLVPETRSATAADLHDLRLESTWTRFGRDLDFLAECTVPAGDLLCSAGGPLYPKPLAVWCRGPKCVLELHLCFFYEVSGAARYGGSLFFHVNGAPVFDDHANHSFADRRSSEVGYEHADACRLAIVPGLVRGWHTVGVTASADIFGGGSPGDAARLTIPSASLVIRVYSSR